jgi:hypothetical protein
VLEHGEVITTSTHPGPFQFAVATTELPEVVFNEMLLLFVQVYVPPAKYGTEYVVLPQIKELLADIFVAT